MKIVLKKSLESFLIENGAYNSFVRNLVRGAGGHPFIPYLIDGINSRFGAACIDGAFVWCSTPEGLDYWNELADMFELVDGR